MNSYCLWGHYWLTAPYLSLLSSWPHLTLLWPVLSWAGCMVGSGRSAGLISLSVMSTTKRKSAGIDF